MSSAHINRDATIAPAALPARAQVARSHPSSRPWQSAPPKASPAPSPHTTSTGYGGSSARSADVVTGIGSVASGDAESAERWRRLAVAVVAGAAMHLAFPWPGWDFLGWVALAPVLALAATARTPGRAFLEGWVGGLAFFLLLMRWLVHTMTTFSTMPKGAAVLVIVAMAAYLGLFWGGVVALPYFCHGVMEAWAAPEVRALAWIELLLAAGVVLAVGIAGLREHRERRAIAASGGNR